MKRCDGCGEIEAHTRDWATIQLPVVSEELHVCSPRCGEIVMERLRPELAELAGEVPLGKRKWNLVEMRKGRR